MTKPTKPKTDTGETSSTAGLGRKGAVEGLGQANANQVAPTAADVPSKPQFGKDQPKSYCGKKGKSGPPKDNRNGMRHGLKAGKLPKDAQYIEVRLNQFRRTLEDAVIACRGEVSLVDAAAIQTCLRWERHAALAQRWLRIEGDKLKPVDLLKFSEAIAKASDARDRALRALNLDREPEPLDLKSYLIEGKTE